MIKYLLEIGYLKQIEIKNNGFKRPKVVFQIVENTDDSDKVNAVVARVWKVKCGNVR